MKRFVGAILPALLSVVIFGALVVWQVLPRTHEAILSHKQEMISELTLSCHSLLATYHKQEEAGLLSREEAQAQALDRLRQVHYGEGGRGYFWIIDLAPRVILNPFRPEMEGMEVSQYADVQGKPFFREVVQVAREQGQGFVSYVWQLKDDPARQGQKLSHVRLFEPWGWVIGTGVYLDEVQEEITAVTGTLTLLGVGVIALVSLLTGYVAWRGVKAAGERKLVREALAESEERFRGISANALDGIVMIDPEGRVSFWNRAAEKIFGYTAEEARGADLHLLLSPPQYHATYRKAFASFQASGQGNAVGTTVELVAVRKDGQAIPVELSVAPLRLGDRWHAVGIIRDITQRKQAEGTLRDSEARYRKLFELANDAIFIVAGMILVDCNQKTLDIFGCDRRGIIGQSLLSFSPERQPDGALSEEQAQQRVAAALEGRPQHFHWRYRRGDGAPFEAEVSLSRIELSGDYYLLAVVRDVTERRRAEEALRGSEALLAQSQRTAHVGSWMLDLVNDRLTWSDETYRIYGVEPQSFPATHEGFLAAVHPEDRDRVEAAYAESLRAGVDTYEVEHRLVRRGTGEVRHVLAWCRHERDAAGTVTRSIGTVQDITERKLAEEALKENEKRLRAIFTASADPLVVYDAQGSASLVNPAFTRIFGWRADEVLGGRIPFVPQDQEETTRSQIEAIYAGGGSGRFQTSRLTKGGERLDVLVSAAGIPDETDNFSGMVVSLTDLTPLKRLEAQLRQAQKMEAIGTLAGGIAHDFNNILSPIMGFTEMVAQKTDNERQRGYLQQVLNASQRARDLIRQILTFSRRTEQEISKVPIAPLMKEITKLLRAAAPKSVDIGCDFQADGLLVLGDPSQIHQLLMNLGTNALQAMQGQKGSLTYTLARVDVAPGQADSPDGLKAGPHAVIRVRDTGVGMSLQVLERLFEPFFTTKVKGEGTGLGLSVVHGIVSQLQGAIKVSSVEGQGSEFVVYLPLAPSVADQPESECREATPEGAESILAVDDEQAIQALYKQTLEDLGYRVTAVGDGDEALALVGGGREAYDLVVTDLAMPGLSGLELAQALTALKPSLPVILITGTPEEFSDQQLVAAGVRRLLRKPFTKDTLARTIRSTLDAARPGPGEGLARPS